MLRFQNITIKTGKRIQIDDLSLDVPDGAVLCLTGSDLTARSLMLKLGTGNLLPDQGEILLDDISVTREPKRLFDRIGYLPRRNGNYRQIRVYEYYEMVLAMYRIRGRNLRRRIEKVLQMLSLQNYSNRFIEELPADAMPFFRLGSAFLHDPDWLFLDLPFEGLDAENRAEIVTVLLDLHEKGTSMILNTEMYPDLIGFITDVAAIDSGKLGLCGQIEEVYENLLKGSPVTMTVLSDMDLALEVLKENSLVDRVLVKNNEVIFHFRGEEKEEAELLRDIVKRGALIQNYSRDRIQINEMFRS